jgi:hypothetical protein
MAIECNSIVHEAELLKKKFQKCKTLKAEDLRVMADLLIALKNCSGTGTGTIIEIIAGENISVNNDDPASPIISAVLTGNTTVSTSTPTGIPADGDEWVTYTE